MVYILIDKWFTKLTRRQKTSPSLFRQAQTLQSANVGKKEKDQKNNIGV